jgi:hypothetical protein
MATLNRARSRRAIDPLLAQAVGYSVDGVHVPDVLDRPEPFGVVGTANLGALNWCEAKGTFQQVQMEPNYAIRAIEIIQSNHRGPRFIHPHPAVCAIEVQKPGEIAVPEPGAPAWAVAEREETKDASCASFVAVLDAHELGLRPPFTIILVGVTDGVRSDGTVVEVRQTGWTWASLLDSGETRAKETQANIYAVMLGLPRWTCVFRCRDGRFDTQGEADAAKAWAAVARGVRFRVGLAVPRGVPRNRKSRCAPQSGRNCEHLGHCSYTPLAR